MMCASKPSKFSSKDEALYRSLQSVSDSKDYAKGIETCELLLKKHPEHVETIAMKAFFLANLDKNSEAVELIKTAIKLDVKSDFAWHYLAIIHRMAKRYEEALRCLRMAVRLVPDNQFALRDISTLQIQARNYTGLVESRFSLLALRPTLRLHWINLAIAYHLAGFPDKAAKTVKLLLAVFPTPNGVIPQSVRVEEGELRLYHARLYEEAGDLPEALQSLTAKSFYPYPVDPYIVLFRRASLLEMTGKVDEASEIFLRLLDVNPESKEVLIKHLTCLGLNLKTKLECPDNDVFSKVYNLYVKYPSSVMLRQETIKRCPISKFRETIVEIILPEIIKNSPSAFHLIKDLDVLEDSASRAACSHNRFEILEKFSIETIEAPENHSYIIYAYIFHSALLEKLGRFEESICFYEKALEIVIKNHKHPIADVLLPYAEILCSLGKFDLAADIADFLCVKEPKDRFINSTAVKYSLRAGRINHAKSTAALFIRLRPFESEEKLTVENKEDESKSSETKKIENMEMNIPEVEKEQSPNKFRTLEERLKDLVDMQASWYHLEMGDIYMAKGDIEQAAASYATVLGFYTEFQEDQFDFHMYAQRRMTLSTYIDLLHFEDSIFAQPAYMKAAIGYVEAKLSSRKDGESNASNKELEQLTLQLSKLCVEDINGTLDLDKIALRLSIYHPNNPLAQLIVWKVWSRNDNIAISARLIRAIRVALSAGIIDPKPDLAKLASITRNSVADGPVKDAILKCIDQLNYIAIDRLQENPPVKPGSFETPVLLQLMKELTT